jgi:hypothetical protein
MRRVGLAASWTTVAGAIRWRRSVAPSTQSAIRNCRRVWRKRASRGRHDRTSFRFQRRTAFGTISIARGGGQAAVTAVRRRLANFGSEPKRWGFGATDDGATTRTYCDGRLDWLGNRFEAAPAILTESKSDRILTTATTAPHPSRGTRGGVKSQVLRTIPLQGIHRVERQLHAERLESGWWSSRRGDGRKHRRLGRKDDEPRFYQRGKGLRISRTKSSDTQ